MIEAIIIAFILAAINKLNIVPTLLSVPMISVYLGALFYLLCMVLEHKNIKLNSSKCGLVYWLLIIVPTIYHVIRYSLYISLIVSIILFILGVILNNIAVNKNEGRMPVYPSLTYCSKKGKQKNLVSENHQIGDETTKVIPLTDIFDFGYNVFSIGDFLIFSGFGIITYQVIKILQ